MAPPVELRDDPVPFTFSFMLGKGGRGASCSRRVKGPIAREARQHFIRRLSELDTIDCSLRTLLLAFEIGSVAHG
jgi:hypothetical protein